MIPESYRRRITVIAAAAAAIGLTMLVGSAGGSPSQRNNIVFLSNRDGGEWQIYLMDLDGSHQRRLIPHRPYPWALVASADLSPDGRYVAFGTWTSLGGNKAERWLYLIDVDGSHLRRLTDRQGVDPAFSPDGRRVAFVSYESGLIYVMNIDGSNVVNTAQPGYAPAWSPDARRIAFNCGYSPPQICAMDDDGARLVHITNDHFWNYAPQYSPDGRIIVFFSERDCAPDCYEIYAMTSDGSNLRRLSPPSMGIRTRPSFTSDGRILFVQTNWHRRPNGTMQRDDSQIYVMNADGTNVRRLTSSPSDNTFAALGY
jgi:Tol biopolymer transport system component